MLLKNKYITLIYCILLSSLTTVFAQDVEYIPFKTSRQVTSNTIQLTSDYSIGAISGHAGSSGTGSASYNVPILIPEGTGGLQPNFSVAYSSSQTKKSILGKGWNLNGLSMISRTSHTIFHDGELKPVRNNGNDRFVLDGARLYPLATNGASGTVYKLEKENQSLITSVGNINNSPSSFTVETKEGIIHVYGGESTAKVTDLEGNPLVWYISASYDKFGNHIRYYYEEVDNEHRLHSVYYNGSASDPRTKIKFKYKKRTDKNFSYSNLKRFNQKSLLERIDVYYGEDIYSSPDWNALKAYTYSFKYSLGEHESYLSEIHKTSGDGQLKYNPTVFYYGQFEDAPLLTESSGYNFTNPTSPRYQDYIVADFNGDGLSDIAKLEVKSTTWSVPNSTYHSGRITYTGFTISINNGDGNSYTDLPRVGFKDNSVFPYHVEYKF